MAGLTHVPAYIRTADQAMLELALVKIFNAKTLTQ